MWIGAAYCCGLVMNAIDAARVGLDTVTHFYGHFESLLKDHVVQHWPVDQINDDEYMRFGQVGPGTELNQRMDVGRTVLSVRRR